MPPASTGIKKYQMNMAVGALAILFAFWADQPLAGLEPETVVFPHVLLWIIKGVGGGDDPERAHLGPEGHLGPAFGSFPFAFIPLAAATVGYVFAGAVRRLLRLHGCVSLCGRVDSRKNRTAKLLTRIIPVAMAIPFLLYWLFYRLLDVRMHSISFSHLKEGNP